MAASKPGSKNPATRAASKGGFKLPPQTRKNYKPPKAKPKTRAAGELCGAKKRNGGTCAMLAGWGTNHPGTGRCKMHAGSTPTMVKSAAKSELRKLLGKPMEINPIDALLMCIKIRAGEIEWMSLQMAKLEEKAWFEETMVGKQFNIYARERQAAMRDLAKFSHMAISLGIAERAVKMAETYGEMLASYTKGILDELWPHLDQEGRDNAPLIVRKHLIALDQGRQLPIDRATRQLPSAA